MRLIKHGKYRKIQFQAFACEGRSDAFEEEEEIEAYAAQRFNHDKPQHPGRSWGKRGPPQFRSSSEQRSHASDPPSLERRPSDLSTNRGCALCGSWRHDLMKCPFRNETSTTSDPSLFSFIYFDELA